MTPRALNFSSTSRCRQATTWFMEKPRASTLPSILVTFTGSTFQILVCVLWQAPEKTLVRAIDLNTLKPVSGAKISIFEGKDKASQAKTLASGTTADDGFVECQLPKSLNTQSSFNSLIIGAAGNSLAYGAMNYWRSSSDKMQTYFYTDRPVYRLGQTVNFKGIARSIAPSGFKNPGKTWI